VRLHRGLMTDTLVGYGASVAVIGFANMPGKADSLTQADAGAVTTGLARSHGTAPTSGLPISRPASRSGLASAALKLTDIVDRLDL
jgi:hypothetical protein